MKHWRCRDCGAITIWPFYHAKSKKSKHQDWNFTLRNRDFDFVRSKFEEVTRILGTWHPVNRIGKTGSK